MKLAPLLLEQKDDSDVAISYIRKNCSQTISFMKSKGLFFVRGLKRSHKFVEFFSRVKGRRPKDTNYGVDQELERYRKKYFSHIVSRNEAFFCFLDNALLLGASQFGAYGTNYVIFPKNGFKVFQSTKIDDFFDSNLNYILRKLVDDGKNIEDDENVENAVRDYFTKANTSLSSLQEGSYEILINAASHVAIVNNEFTINPILKSIM